MAEGTRLKDLNEHMLSLESKMQSLTSEYQGRVSDLANQIKEVREVEQKHYETILKDSASRHEELLMLLTTRNVPVEKGQTSQSAQKEYPNNMGNKSVKMEIRDSKGKGLLPMPHRDFELREEDRRESLTGKNSGSHHTPYPRLEFPIFAGEEPRVWIENCEQYFEVYQTPQRQWLGIATMHMTGRARTWKQSYLINRQIVSWDEFVEALYRRFGQTGERYLIREFNNLKQLGTVERYQEKFEELRTQLICFNPQLTEEHSIACYINGLREDLIPFMDIGHPNTLEEAYEQAKLHEKALTVISRKYKPSPRTMGGSYQPNTFFKPQPVTTQKSSFTNTNPSKGGGNPIPYNKSLLEQRRAAGQCFKCGDRYYPGHICSSKSLNHMRGMENILEIFDEDCITEETQEFEPENNTQEDKDTLNHEEGVSVHALRGTKPQDTIKIQ